MCIGGDAYTRTCPSALYTGGREHWSVLTIVVMGLCTCSLRLIQQPDKPGKMSSFQHG